jgi:hypothetical protein
MRLYIFKSETRKGLYAFAGDAAGDRLPPHHGPWTGTGVVGADKDPPNRLARETIETAFDGEGFQLWRRLNPQTSDGTVAASAGLSNPARKRK